MKNHEAAFNVKSSLSSISRTVWGREALNVNQHMGHSSSKGWRKLSSINTPCLLNEWTSVFGHLNQAGKHLPFSEFFKFLLFWQENTQERRQQFFTVLTPNPATSNRDYFITLLIFYYFQSKLLPLLLCNRLKTAWSLQCPPGVTAWLCMETFSIYSLNSLLYRKENF